MKKQLIALGVIVLLIIGVVLFASPSKQETPVRFGGTTNLNGLVLSANIVTGGVVSTSTATSTGAVLGQSDLYLPTGELASGVNFTASTSATTLTTAASSSYTTIVPNAGDTVTFYLYNASTTGTTTTLAAGTGITLLNATTTKIMQPGSLAVLTFIRLANTNINVLMNIFK